MTHANCLAQCPELGKGSVPSLAFKYLSSPHPTHMISVWESRLTPLSFLSFENAEFPLLLLLSTALCFSFPSTWLLNDGALQSSVLPTFLNYLSLLSHLEFSFLSVTSILNTTSKYPPVLPVWYSLPSGTVFTEAADAEAGSSMFLPACILSPTTIHHHCFNSR